MDDHSPARTGVLTARAWLGAALFFAVAGVQAGTPYPHARTPAPQDVGALELMRGSPPLTVTVALKPRDADKLQALATAMHTDGSPQFHRFLTPEEYHQRFDPDPGAVAAAVAHFNQAGLSTRLDAGNLLRVTGSAQAAAGPARAPALPTSQGIG